MENNLGNKKTMAANIRRYMKERNISAVEVCDALGFPKATFSNWCNGITYPRIDKIEKMAKFFGVTKSDLVEDYTEEERKKNELERVVHDAFLDPNLRILFNLASDASPEDVEMVIQMLQRLKTYKDADLKK